MPEVFQKHPERRACPRERDIREVSCEQLKREWGSGVVDVCQLVPMPFFELYGACCCTQCACMCCN